jgi:hypothetical protein
MSCNWSCHTLDWTSKFRTLFVDLQWHKPDSVTTESQLEPAARTRIELGSRPRAHDWESMTIDRDDGLLSASRARWPSTRFLSNDAEVSTRATGEVWTRWRITLSEDETRTWRIRRRNRMTVLIDAPERASVDTGTGKLWITNDKWVDRRFGWHSCICELHGNRSLSLEKGLLVFVLFRILATRGHQNFIAEWYAGEIFEFL